MEVETLDSLKSEKSRRNEASMYVVWKCIQNLYFFLYKDKLKIILVIRLRLIILQFPDNVNDNVRLSYLRYIKFIVGFVKHINLVITSLEYVRLEDLFCSRYKKFLWSQRNTFSTKWNERLNSSYFQEILVVKIT